MSTTHGFKIIGPKASKSSPDSPLSPIHRPLDCIVCLDAPRNCCLVPCGHKHMCVGCSEALTLCPVCKRTIQQRVHVFED